MGSLNHWSKMNLPRREDWDSLATLRQRLAAQDTEIQRLREERDNWKWVARETAENLHSTIRIREQRAEAAEAENRRLTEGLREIHREATQHHQWWSQEKARVLLAGSEAEPDEGGEA